MLERAARGKVNEAVASISGERCKITGFHKAEVVVYLPIPVEALEIVKRRKV